LVRTANGKAKVNGTSPVIPGDDPHELVDLDGPEVLEEDLFDADDLPDESDAAVAGTDDHIDDPVRIYLMQMGEIPLLTRR